MVAAGTYSYSIDDIIAIGFSPGGWTLDLRGVTLTCTVPTPDKTLDQGIYINQSEDFTILSGTIWFDQGELWSQARVTSVASIEGDSINSLATFEVEKGYNVDVWKTAGSRNQGCVDTSNANHFTRPDCNFWYSSDYDFSQLYDKRTFTSKTTSRGGLKIGYIVTTISGPALRTTVASEFNGGLTIKGMMSNGTFAQHGLTGKKTATILDWWTVNPAPQPGVAQRVNEPTLSGGHIDNFNFNADGQPDIIWSHSFWQYTGCQKDVKSMDDLSLPSNWLIISRTDKDAFDLLLCGLSKL
ncbi:MAG: hypothetical protein Q9181_002466, partial [Wetmoreana brouardii]